MSFYAKFDAKFSWKSSSVVVIHMYSYWERTIYQKALGKEIHAFTTRPLCPKCLSLAYQLWQKTKTLPLVACNRIFDFTTLSKPIMEKNCDLEWVVLESWLFLKLSSWKRKQTSYCFSHSWLRHLVGKNPYHISPQWWYVTY